MKHGELYDYSKVFYINAITEVIILCKKHGEFKQSPTNHLRNGYWDCGREKQAISLTSTTEIYISKANVKHDNIYDYSKTNYINAHTKIIIICKIHGMFMQDPHNHLAGRGCKKCSDEKLSISMTHTTEEFVNNANIIHKFLYDYSKTIYVGCFDNVIIICGKHGEFSQIASNHLSGRGCQLCCNEKISISMTYTTEEFIEKAMIVHKGVYNYSKVDYVHSQEKIIIICSKHGNFLQTPSSHLSSSGCPKCVKNGYSKIALEWIELFSEYINIQTVMDINGEHKIKIKQLSTYWKDHIKVDGYCEEHNLCFEFDGCLFHGCDQCKCKDLEENPLTGVSMKYLREKTIAKHNLIRLMGYNLIVIKECEYNIMKKENLLEKYAEDLYFSDDIFRK